MQVKQEDRGHIVNPSVVCRTRVKRRWVSSKRGLAHRRGGAGAPAILWVDDPAGQAWLELCRPQRPGLVDQVGSKDECGEPVAVQDADGMGRGAVAAGIVVEGGAELDASQGDEARGAVCGRLPMGGRGLGLSCRRLGGLGLSCLANRWRAGEQVEGERARGRA